MGEWLGRTPWAWGWLFFAATVGAAPPSADQLRAWVDQLDHDNFVLREEASRNLVAASEAAIPALCNGITSSSPEASWRCTSALEQMALVGDDATLSRVTAALEGLQRSGKSGLAGVIQDLRGKQLQLRRDRALAKIRALGGKVDGEEPDTSVENGPGQLQRIDEIVDILEKPVAIGTLEVTVNISPNLHIEPLPANEPPPGGAQPPAANVAAIAPPPDLPTDAIAQPLDAMPLAAVGNVFIADAFASPEILVAPGLANEGGTVVTLDRHWRGGATGLAALRDLPNLASLSIIGAKLTNEALEQIATFPRLRDLDIECTPFSAEGLLKFRERRPQTRVFARGTAMLGVHAEMAGPCVLTGVYAGSGAAEAGLKEGDVIVTVAGQKVRDFSDLTIAIFSHLPGEKLRVEFEREATPQSADVVLKERKTPEAVRR
jgi:hypothetical protein